MSDISNDDRTRIEQRMEHRVNYHFEEILLRGMTRLSFLTQLELISFSPFQLILQRICQHRKVWTG